MYVKSYHQKIELKYVFNVYKALFYLIDCSVVLLATMLFAI